LKIVSLSEGWKKSAFNLTSSVKLKELELFDVFSWCVVNFQVLFSVLYLQLSSFHVQVGQIWRQNFSSYFFAVVKIYSFHHCSVYTWHIPNRNISSRSLHTLLSSKQFFKRHILTRTNIFSKKPFYVNWYCKAAF